MDAWIHQSTLTDIGNAIRAKNGESESYYPSEMAGKIAAIPTEGVVEIPPKEINFVDYDGRIVAAWNMDDLQSVSALPANPVHAGLTAQGWNFTLADIKAANRPMTIGQAYITDDGKTRITLSIRDEGRMSPSFSFNQTVANGVTFDWGDGNPAETVDGTGDQSVSHTYATAGEYTVSVAVAEGCIFTMGQGTAAAPFVGFIESTGRAYQNMVQKIEIGLRTEIGGYAFQNCYLGGGITIPVSMTAIGDSAFQNCYGMPGITLPEGMETVGNYAFQNCYGIQYASMACSATSIGRGAFYNCYRMTEATVPDDVTSVGNYIFQNCYSLVRVSVPGDTTSIGSNAFQNCVCLTQITIPGNVKSIGGNAFNGCASMKAFYVTPAAPPALVNANAFGGMSSDCIIYVPAASLTDYQAATNWSIYAAQMQGM